MCRTAWWWWIDYARERKAAARTAATALVLTAAAALSATLATAASFRLTLLVQADDPRLTRSRLERAAIGHPSGPVADALRVALAENRLELDTAGAKLELEVLEAADVAAAKAAAVKAEMSGAAALLSDLPAPWTLAVADASKLPVLNVGSAADTLRQAGCRRNLFHLSLSKRMRSDALAQALVARRWAKVLLLTGPGTDDAARAATARASIARYGLKLVAHKPFELSADPRERELASRVPIELLESDLRPGPRAGFGFHPLTSAAPTAQ